MLTVDWFKGKNVTVMGLGLHGGGLGAAIWLLRHGAILTVTDLKDQHALAPSIAELERAYLKEARRQGKHRVHRVRYVLGRHDKADFSGADLIIQNPGVPREHPLLALAKKSRVPIESEISLFFQLCPFPITAISGSKGKTTATTLLAAICKAADRRTVVGGNLRKSALEPLDRILRWRKPSPIVLELSSWQLESLAPHRISPQIGALTNILRDHLNRYRDLEDYALAKSYLIRYQRPDDTAVLNADDRLVVRMVRGSGRVVWFSTEKKLKAGWFLQGKNIVCREEGKQTAFLPVAAMRIPGRHNIANVLAACAAARALRIPLATIRRVARSFTGVPYRLEMVAVNKGVRYVNDTTATMPDAAVAALETIDRHRNIILIAGGADKSLEFKEWAKAVKKHVKHLILFDGAATEKMEAALVAAKANVSMVGARNMREAVTEARRHAKSGDIILLSPGCASFGLFQHEFDRGDQFNREVKKR